VEISIYFEFRFTLDCSVLDGGGTFLADSPQSTFRPAPCGDNLATMTTKYGVNCNPY